MKVGECCSALAFCLAISSDNTNRGYRIPVRCTERSKGPIKLKQIGTKSTNTDITIRLDEEYEEECGSKFVEMGGVAAYMVGGCGVLG